MGKGSSSPAPAPTSQTVTQTNLPAWAQPYSEQLLGQTQALTDINQNPYQQYGGQMVADFTPMQQQAFSNIGGMQPSAATGAGIGVTANVAQQAPQYGSYSAQQFGNQYQGQNFGNMGLGYLSANTQNFNDPATAQSYMNPYTQNVVNIQQREAQRQADIAKTGRNAQAVAAGSFGGSRQAISDAEAARNLATQKGDIQSQGLNTAYNQAQQSFQADQARQLQAQQANQGAYGQMQGLGMQQNLAGNAQNMQNAQLRAQYGLAGQQAGEQSRQYGANLGLQGLQQQLAAAGQLGQLGQQQYSQQMGINQAQQGVGAQQQAMNQQNLTNQYQNFLNQQNYPYKQLGFMSDILHGTPTGGTTLAQSTAAPPNMMGQIAGLTLGAGSLLTGASNAGIGKKEGGVIKGYKKGGAVKHFDEGGITSLLTDPSTELAAKMPPNRPPITTAEALAKFMLPVIQKMHQPIATPGTTTVAEDMAMEILGRKQQQQMAQAPEQQQPQQMAMQEQMPQEQQMQTMAGGGLASLPSANFNDDSFVGGGIIAFANEGEVKGEVPKPEDDKKPKSDKKSRVKKVVEPVKPAAPAEVVVEPVKPAAPAASTPEPVKPAVKVPVYDPAEFQKSEAKGKTATPEPVKPAVKVPVYDPAEFRAGQGAAGAGKPTGTQSYFSKIRDALQPKLLNPNVTASGEGILSGLGKVAKYAGKSVGPLAALDIGKTALDLANMPTDMIREYYGDREEPSFLGDVGIRSRAALGSLMPFSDTAEGLRALQQKQSQTTAPVVADAASEKDKSGLTADQRAAAFIANLGGGGGGGAGGGGGRAGAGGAGAGNAVANTGLSPELKTLMDSRAANLAEMKAQLAADKPKGLEDYIKAEESIYAKAGIGNAAKEERERLNARLAGMQGEQRAAFLRDLSKAGFAMAQNASQHGATFLGSAAAGGMNFSESNAKTAEHFANLSETLASTKAKLAQSDEAVRAGMIAKGSAEHKEARKEYANAQRDLTRYEGTMNASDIAAVRAIEVARMNADRDLAKAHVTGGYQLQAARIAQGNKDVVENRLKRAYEAAIGKGDNAAAQAILKQLQAITEAVNPQKFTAPSKTLDPTQILGLRAQLKLAKKNEDKDGIALYSSLLAPYMPSEAAAGAGVGVPADLAKKYGL